MNEEMRAEEVIGHKRGRAFCKGLEKQRGSFFFLDVCGRGVIEKEAGGTDRKPLMNSEKRTDVIFHKERMLKEFLVCFHTIATC